MKAKNILYAAVGAPVVAARKVSTRAGDLSSKLSEQATNYTKSLGQTMDSWAAEGEKVVVRVSEGKMVDEITSKVDLDQAKEQVSKLRDQLEDMLDTWRHSFRPEKSEGKEPTKAKSPSAKTTAAPAKEPAAKSSAKTAAKTSSAKVTTSAAAKTSSPDSPEAPEAEKAS